jgi:hypothetical protein
MLPQAGSGDEDRANDLAVLALDANLTIPASQRGFRKTAGVVRIALVDPDQQVHGCGEHRCRRADRCASGRASRQLAIAPVPKPIRSAEGACLRITGASALGSDAALPGEQNLAVLIHNANRRLFLRHVPTNVLLHRCSPADVLP